MKQDKKSMYVHIKTIELAWKSLHKNKFRSFLTSLGIIIGAATIVLVIEMGAGASEKIEEQYSNMSVTTILINAPSGADGKRSKLSDDDIDALLVSENITNAVPQLSGKMQVTGGDNSDQFNIIGTASGFTDIASIKMNSGEFFTNDDEDDHTKVVVIGATVAEELYGDRNAKVVG